MNPAKFFWGIIIILVGLMILAGNLGLIPSGFWSQLWRLWPLALIILGAGFIFSKEKRSGWFLASLIILVLVLTGSLIWWSYDLTDQTRSKTIVSENYYSEASILEVDINYGAADLKVTSASDSKAIVGTIDSFGEPSITKEIKDGREKIVVNQLKEGPRLWGVSNSKNELDLKIIDRVPLDLIINTGASKFDLNLENIKINKLDINCGASSGNIKIGSNNKEVNIALKSGASSFNLSVPKDAGLNITNKSGLSSNNFSAIGLKQNDKNYKSENFDTAAQKINLTFETGASSIKIDQY